MAVLKHKSAATQQQHVYSPVHAHQLLVRFLSLVCAAPIGTAARGIVSSESVSFFIVSLLSR